MARAIWTGAISFGLVNIPVRLYAATRSHRIDFHQFQRGTGKRVRYKRVAEGSGKEVPFDQIVRGVEVRKGKFVTIESEELEAVEPRKTRTIEIQDFVPLAQIDPIVWNETYYIGPDAHAGAQRAYATLTRAMEDAGRVAIGTFVMREKEHLVTVRPTGSLLTLETMNYADEIRDPKEEVANVPKAATVTPRELALAKQLISALASDWDHARYQDTFRDRVAELVKRKSRGEEIVAAPEQEQVGQVVDLMEALKASLANPRAGDARGSAGKRGRATGRTPAQRSAPAAARANARVKKAPSTVRATAKRAAERPTHASSRTTRRKATRS